MLLCTRCVTNAVSEGRDLNPDTIKAERSSNPHPKLHSLLRRNPVPILLAAFSLFYFAETCLRASEKYFWYDELYTVYICRLPSLHASWDAVLRGADFNPPLLYLLTRLSNAVVGEGLVGTRLPEMISFWIFCLCLFRFVNRRCGALAGFIAMVFPMLTVADYYAYEARPHAIVLGFCGLALVFWQMMEEQPGRTIWQSGFGLSLAGAFLSHCYAVVLIVPFAIVEVFSIVSSRRVIWGRWAAMAVPLIASMAASLPLLRSYKSIDSGTTFTRYFAARWSGTPAFYRTLLTPSLLTTILAVVLLLLALCLRDRIDHVEKQRLRSTDLVLAAGFLALPFFGVILGKIIEGPFVARYFMPAVLGLAVLFGFAASRCRPKWLASALVAVVLMSLGRDFALLILHRRQGWGELLREPSTQRLMNTTPGRPLYAHPLLTSGQNLPPLPIAFSQAFDFLYLANYDPALRSRLYYVGDLQTDTNLREYNLMRKLCHLNFNPGYGLHNFVKTNGEFFVYGELQEMPQLSAYEAAGAVIRSIKVDGMYFLAEMHIKSAN